MPTDSLVRNERGSVIVIALVLIFVMTILGLALFDLAQIEGQMASTSQADARALYIAQAGLERGIRELRNGFVADAYPSASWADATNGPTCTPLACDATIYRTMNIANTAVPATGTDPGGTYTLEMKLVTVGEANNPISAGYTYPYGQECIVSFANYFIPAAVCDNLVFLRSTGTVNGPPGQTSTATIQTLVKATPTSPFAAALTAAGTTWSPNPAIAGDVVVAGTVQALGTGNSNPLWNITGGASDGMRNNYAALNGTYELDRIQPRQLICPPQTNCAAGTTPPLVESLGAELRLYGNVTYTMVNVGNNTILGQTADTAPYGQGGQRAGKGRLDGVYIVDGCALPCTGAAPMPFTLGAGAAVNVDAGNLTKPYPDQPARLPLWYLGGLVYPILNNPTSINGTAYASYSTNFFVPKAASLYSDPMIQGAPPPGSFVCTPFDAAECIGDGNPAHTLGWYFESVNGSFRPGPTGTPSFRHSFTFTDKTGTVRTAEMCWKRTTLSGINQGGNLPAQPNGPAGYDAKANTLEFGIPTCASPNPPTDPILIYWGAGADFTFSYTGASRQIAYRGSAIFLLQGASNPNLRLEETLISYCIQSFTSPGTQCAAGERFAEDHLLVFLTPNTVEIGIANANVDTVMAYVWTDQFLSIQRDAKVIGSLRANHLCFKNSSTAPCSVSGGSDPAVYQATPIDLRKIPEELPGGGASGDRWRIGSLPRFWMVCRPGTLPSTPTGNCGYQ